MDGRTACATCGGTGIGWDLFSCPDCDGQGSTPTQPPAPTEATARDVSADDAIAVAVINWELNGKKGRPSQAVRSALDSAGLVVVERKHMIGLRTELARCGLFGLVDTVKAMTGEDVENG